MRRSAHCRMNTKILYAGLGRGNCFTCLKSAPPAYIADLKNVYMEGMEAIIVGDPDLYKRIRLYFQSELSGKLDLLKLYDNPLFPLDKLYSTRTSRLIKR